MTPGKKHPGRANGTVANEQKRQRAMQAFQAGQWQQAQNLYRDICHANPKDANAWFMLGAIAGQEGNYGEAERCFREALRCMPRSAATLDNLGNAISLQGRLREAEACYRKALKIDPRHVSAYLNLGNLLWRQGKHEAAEHQLGTALRLNPACAEAHNSLGLVLRDQGKLEDAIQHLQQATRLRPDYADAHHNLGDTCKQTGDLDKSLRHYLRAIALNPGLAVSHCNLAALYEELRHKQEAQEHFQTALRLDPNLPGAVAGLARVLAGTDKHAEARSLLEQGVTRFPDNAEISAALADILIRQGLRQEAGKLLEPFTGSKEPDACIALSYATLHRRTDKRPQAIELLEKSFSARHINAFQKEAIGHALGALYELDQAYEKAFQACALANNARQDPSDLEMHLATMRSIKTTFSAGFLSSQPQPEKADETPIFIVGMPRSGTSLVEQILSRHPDVHGAGEVTYLWEITGKLPSGAYPESVPELSREQLDNCAQQYLGAIRAHSPDARRITDKLPHNFLHIGFIETILPGARIIHCTRDPRDTCLSIFFQRFNTNHIYSRDLRELGIYYRHYQALMRHWKSVANIPILDVCYEDLVEDLESRVRALLEFCGLDWHPDCLEFHKSRRVVNTPSFDQVSRPLYSSSIGRWKKHQSRIQPLLEGLSEHVGD